MMKEPARLWPAVTLNKIFESLTQLSCINVHVGTTCCQQLGFPSHGVRSAGNETFFLSKAQNCD